MKSLGIPTQINKTFTNYTEASLFIKENFNENNPYYVIKVSGLAGERCLFSNKTRS